MTLVDARPTIALTMGDPLGIGPEVVAKALTDARVRAAARLVVYGQNHVLQLAAGICGIEPLWFRVAASSDRARGPLAQDPVLLDFDCPDALLDGRPQPTKSGGLASKTFVEEAITDAMRAVGDPRRVDAVVTAPICKESWALAGYRWPGHTELFAFRSHARHHAMAFVSPKLRVALATTHIPLMAVRDVLTIGAVYTPIDLGAQLCRSLGIHHPRIAVCGLNPHAGEQGLFGDEEQRVILPAVNMARGQGIDANGPFSADTLFGEAVQGRWDLVVAMYHDQGLIPVKLLDWEHAVNITLGLPFMRTSPDHGTAFGIAGTGKASASSLIESIVLAAQLAVSTTRGASTTPHSRVIAPDPLTRLPPGTDLG
ncbi:MAG: 4-hydroxythreonine-4-phosphate dehydrogenase PdxA [Planctomycetota bacterium]|nr:4-hydroxythreonine-4-phosphate dehydrogenase PdxA [Planctomycetota bacterium]MDA1106657.1 4-hydroxythreonine-4-phosphate dehydrogenase PdxA [Planctomycetota bacterium]